MNKCIQSSDQPTAVVFGNETKGVSKEMEALANSRVAIEMQGEIESLNVAVCAGVVLYQISKS